PTANAPLPSAADTTPTASSGMLVPIDTTVRPTTTGLIPSRDANFPPPLTITSAPTTRAPRPAKNQAALVSMGSRSFIVTRQRADVLPNNYVRTRQRSSFHRRVGVLVLVPSRSCRTGDPIVDFRRVDPCRSSAARLTMRY